jgi:hypothetical protein
MKFDGIVTVGYFLLNLPLLQTGDGSADILNYLFQLADKTDGALKYVINILIGLVLLALSCIRLSKAWLELKELKKETRKSKTTKSKGNESD